MTTQQQAADLYNDLQAQAADESAATEAFQRAADADWYRRHPDERRAVIGQDLVHLDDEDRRRMALIPYVVGAFGLACMALIAFVLPWAALVQWAVSGDTRWMAGVVLGWLVACLVWRGLRRGRA